MEQINLWLDANLQNQYWRVAIIIAVALVIALLLRVLLVPLLLRLSRRTASRIDDRVFELFWPALLRTVLLEGVYIATMDFVQKENIDAIVHSVTVTLMVLIWGRFLAAAADIIFKRLSETSDKYPWIQPQTLPLVKFIFKVTLFGIMTYLLMAAWHVNLTSWLASAGVMGIAVGFAAKDTLANFIAGIFILADAPYKVGQYIIIDGETRGVVTEIGIRSTRLLTRDNVEVTVPNAVIGNAKIVNESSGPSPKMRVRVVASVAYGSDVDEVRAILEGCLQDLPNTSDSKDGVVRFVSMGESSLDFQVLVWITHPVFRGRVIDALNTSIYKALTSAGIQIPFPQRDLHIKNWPSPPQV